MGWYSSDLKRGYGMIHLRKKVQKFQNWKSCLFGIDCQPLYPILESAKLQLRKENTISDYFKWNAESGQTKLTVSHDLSRSTITDQITLDQREFERAMDCCYQALVSELETLVTITLTLPKDVIYLIQPYCRFHGPSIISAASNVVFWTFFAPKLAA